MGPSGGFAGRRRKRRGRASRGKLIPPAWHREDGRRGGAAAVPAARARPPGARGKRNRLPPHAAWAVKTLLLPKPLPKQGCRAHGGVPVPEPSASVPGRVQGQWAALDRSCGPPIRRRNPDKMPRRAITGTPRGNACLARHGAGLGEPGHAGRCPGSTQAECHPRRDVPGYRAHGNVGMGLVGRPRGPELPKAGSATPPPRPCPGLWPLYSLGLDKGGGDNALAPLPGISGRRRFPPLRHQPRPVT